MAQNGLMKDPKGVSCASLGDVGDAFVAEAEKEPQVLTCGIKTLIYALVPKGDAQQPEMHHLPDAYLCAIPLGSTSVRGIFHSAKLAILSLLHNDLHNFVQFFLFFFPNSRNIIIFQDNPI